MNDNNMNDSFSIESNDPNANTKVLVHRSGSIEVQRFPNQEYKDEYETIARTTRPEEQQQDNTMSSDDLLNSAIKTSAATATSANVTIDPNSSSFQPYSATGNITNSRAVLSALRALQDKIRKLEIERTQYSSQCLKLEDNLKEYRRQIGNERKKVVEQQRKRAQEVQKVEKQAHEFELSAARTEERIKATIIDLNHEREDKTRVMDENERNKAENVKLNVQLKDANTTIILRQSDLDNERSLRQVVEAKLAEAKVFIAKCVQLNEQCVQENTILIGEASIKDQQIGQMASDMNELKEQLTVSLEKRKELAGAVKKKKTGLKKKGGKRGRRIGTHHRQTTVSRERAMRHGHYQNETENTRIRRKARRKKNRSPSPPITSSPTSYQGKTSPVAAINSDSNRKASKYHWGHMNLKEQLRQANLGKDPPFMPSGNASAPDFSIYSVTQRRLGNSKAYGEPDNESSARKSTRSSNRRSSPPPHPPQAEKARLSPPPQATIVNMHGGKPNGSPLRQSQSPPLMPHDLRQDGINNNNNSNSGNNVQPRIIPVISPNSLQTANFGIRKLYDPIGAGKVGAISSSSSSGLIMNTDNTTPLAGLEKVMQNMEKEYSELHTRYRSMLKSVERCTTENLDVNKEALTAAMESLVAKLQAKSEQLMIVRRQLYLRKNEKMEDGRTSHHQSPEKIQVNNNNINKNNVTPTRRGQRRGRSRSPSGNRSSRRSRSPANSHGSRSPVRSNEAFRGQREALELLRSYREARSYKGDSDGEDEQQDFL